MAKILRQYDSDFGITYVQVMIGDSRAELAFDHEPKQEEIDKQVAEMEAASIPLPEVPMIEAKPVTVDTAISLLKLEYSKLPTDGKYTVEQAKLAEFMKAPTAEVKP
jgi:hypothetical protein